MDTDTNKQMEDIEHVVNTKFFSVEMGCIVIFCHEKKVKLLSGAHLMGKQVWGMRIKFQQ